MSAFREGIEAQPQNLAAAADSFRDASGELDLAAMRAGAIVLAGIGASAHALIPAVRALRAAGRRAFALQATELTTPAARELADTFVLVSQSGTSTETLAALEALDGARVVAISARADSPLVRSAQAWLPLGPRTDTPVSTLSYTATLQALGLLTDALLSEDREPGVWSSLPELAAAVLAGSAERVARLAQSFAEISSVDAVGEGPALASAAETALLVREALRIPATGMETREYLHGPLEAVEPGFGAVVFGHQRERELAGQLASFGARVALIGAADGLSPNEVETFEVPDAGPLARAILEILPVQLLVDEVATIRSLPVGEFRRHQDDTKAAE
jgi:glucosamine--fructose-6-phosphate aminotransferase (isomerizing)